MENCWGGFGGVGPRGRSGETEKRRNGEKGETADDGATGLMTLTTNHDGISVYRLVYSGVQSKLGIHFHAHSASYSSAKVLGSIVVAGVGFSLISANIYIIARIQRCR